MRTFASISAFSLALAVLLTTAVPAAAKPTDAQLSAIKANCRSDFMSNCWGTPRGGAEAFQCLKDHMAKLSPGCQQAVKAAIPAPAPAATPATAKPEAAPAAPSPSPAAAAPPATETPPPAEEAKTAPAATPQATPQTEPAASPGTAKPAAPAQSATAAPSAPPQQAKTQAPSAPEAPSPAAATPEEAPPVIGFLPPRKKLMVLKNCRQDLETYCAGVPYGEGRNLRCLFGHKAALTPDCQGALAKLTH